VLRTSMCTCSSVVFEKPARRGTRRLARGIGCLRSCGPTLAGRTVR
jgi:hypothetical protein